MEGMLFEGGPLNERTTGLGSVPAITRCSSKPCVCRHNVPKRKNGGRDWGLGRDTARSPRTRMPFKKVVVKVMASQ